MLALDHKVIPSLNKKSHLIYSCPQHAKEFAANTRHDDYLMDSDMI